MPAKAKTARAAAKPRYSQHPLFEDARAQSAQLEKDTGRTLDAWVAVARKRGFAKQNECSAWLRGEHGLKPMQSSWIAWYATSPEAEAGYDVPEKLVDALFSGPRAALRPIHEKVVDAALALGDDVVVTACKTMVPFYRKHVFAESRPGDGGVELSLALGDVPARGRLQPNRRRAPGDRVAHTVLLRSEKDVDAEVRRWLAQAYALGAGKIARKVDVAMPVDVAKALKSSKRAATTWDSCTPAMRRDFIVWIESAKQEETRVRRIAQAVGKLAEGKKRMY